MTIQSNNEQMLQIYQRLIVLTKTNGYCDFIFPPEVLSQCNWIYLKLIIISEWDTLLHNELLIIPWYTSTNHSNKTVRFNKAANPSMLLATKVLCYTVHPHWRDVLISPVHLLYCQWLICIEVFLHNFTFIKEMLPDNCNMSLTSQLCGEF